MITTESLPSDIYAITDIHGRADLLEAMLGYIAAASDDHRSKPVVIFTNRPVPDFENIAPDIRRIFPHHVDLLENALKFKEIGRFCFVHAGIRPGVQLANQSEYDLRWIRAGFLDHIDVLDHVVLHGHTITKSLRPEVYSNRIALDTGAYQTGRLSAAVIRRDELSRFVCTELTETGAIQVGEWHPN